MQHTIVVGGGPKCSTPRLVHDNMQCIDGQRALGDTPAVSPYNRSRWQWRTIWRHFWLDHAVKMT